MNIHVVQYNVHSWCHSCDMFPIEDVPEGGVPPPPTLILVSHEEALTA